VTLHDPALPCSNKGEANDLVILAWIVYLFRCAISPNEETRYFEKCGSLSDIPGSCGYGLALMWLEAALGGLLASGRGL